VQDVISSLDDFSRNLYRTRYNVDVSSSISGLDALRERQLATPRVAMGVGDLNPSVIQHQTVSILSHSDPGKNGVTQYKLTFSNPNIEIYVAKSDGHYDPIVPDSH